jgi:CheY-like chemotaxis protein
MTAVAEARGDARGRPGRILYLEDDADIRESMVEFLTDEGYGLTAVSTAEDALSELERGSRYHLLLTDYRLPKKNADWLLRVAKAKGLLSDTAVIVLSGEFNPAGIEAYKLLRKPVDVEVLLGHITSAMGPEIESRAPGPPAAAGARPGGAVVLRLYVSAASNESRKAARNLQHVLQGFDPTRILLTVHDVSGADDSWWEPAEEDRIVVTPTLVRRHPAPKVWILGDLSRRELVAEMISAGLTAT